MPDAAPFTPPFRFNFGPEGFTIESAAHQAIRSAAPILSSAPSPRVLEIERAFLAEVGARTVEQWCVLSAAGTVLFTSQSRAECEEWAGILTDGTVRSRLVTITPWRAAR